VTYGKANVVGCCCDLQEVGSSLSVQALNAAGVPLAVDKCINFIALYGQMLLYFPCENLR